MKQLMTLTVLLCICSIAVAENDPNEPQSKDAKAAAATAATNEASVVQTYEAIVRRAATDLIDSKITILVRHKEALNAAILKLEKTQSGKSDFVKATIRQEIGRIKAKIKSIDARLTEQYKIKKNLRKWRPAESVAVKKHSKLATLSCPPLSPLPLKKVRITHINRGIGKLATWIDDLPQSGIAVVNGRQLRTPLTCTKAGYVAIGIGESDNIDTWSTTFSDMKDTGNTVTVTYDTERLVWRVEKFRIWLGKLKPGKWTVTKTGHHGRQIFIVANWVDSNEAKGTIDTWQPEQPKEGEAAKGKTKSTTVKKHNKLATLSCPGLNPLPAKQVTISRRLSATNGWKKGSGKFISWLDDLPTTGVAALDGTSRTLTCIEAGYVIIGIGDTDHVKSWQESTFSGMKNTGKTVAVKYENGEVEKFHIWLGKVEPGKRATKKTGHHGHEIFIVANWENNKDAKDAK